MNVQRIVKIAIGVLVVAIVVVSGALLRFVFSGGRPSAPRTELERVVFSSEEAVRANPNDPAARIKLAAAYLEEKNTRGAMDQAKVAVRLQPDKPDAYYMLGLAQDATGDHAGAVKTLTKAVGIKGQLAQFYQDTYVALGQAQEQAGDAKAALASMSKAIDYGPENTVVLVARGDMYKRMNKFYEAAVDYVWTLYYDPQNSQVRSELEQMARDHAAEVKKASQTVAKIADGDLPPGEKSPSVDGTSTK